MSQAQSWKIWAGYAFENLCLKHVSQIKKALGISAIYTESSSFFFAGNDQQEGLQVDLLIDRKDHIINLCELKFHATPLVCTKALALELRGKVARFKTITKTKKQVSLTLVSAFGLQQNEHSLGLIDQSIALNALFKPA